MKKYIELTAEERAEVNRRITAVIGTSADIDKIEDTTDRMITLVWVDDQNRNGVTLTPTGGYGFPLDVYDDQL